MPRCCSNAAPARSASIPRERGGRRRRPDRRRAPGLLRPQHRPLHGARAPRRPLRAGHAAIDQRRSRRPRRRSPPPIPPDRAQIRAPPKARPRARSSSPIRPARRRSPPRCAAAPISLHAAARRRPRGHRPRAASTRPPMPRPRPPALADAVFAAAPDAVVGPVRGAARLDRRQGRRVQQVAGRTLGAGARRDRHRVEDPQDRRGARRHARTRSTTRSPERDLRRGRRRRKLAASDHAGAARQRQRPAQPRAGRPDPRADRRCRLQRQRRRSAARWCRPVRTAASPWSRSAASSPPRRAARPRSAPLSSTDFTADRARQAARRRRQRDPRQGQRRHAARRRRSPAPAPSGPRPIAAARAELAQNPRGAPPPLALMFSMAPNAAKTARGAEQRGLVRRPASTAIEPGDARGNPARSPGDARRARPRRSATNMSEQFARAARNAVGVRDRRRARSPRVRARPARPARQPTEIVTRARPARWPRSPPGRPGFVWRRQVADTETPVAAALKLIEPGRGDFLLESVEGGAIRGRHSLIGLAPDLVFRAARRRRARSTARWLTDRDAFDALRRADARRAARAGRRRAAMDVPAELPPRARLPGRLFRL